MRATMRPFWSYYGGKGSLAAKYPRPTHRRLVEPFAGGASYSIRHYLCDVVLVEKDARLAGMWRYIIGASPADIRRLPLVRDTRDMPDSVCDEARLLVGFNMGAGTQSERFRLSPWGAWGYAMRERIAWQVNQVKHWRIIEGDYTSAPTDSAATWFVDPPYQAMGHVYRHSSADIDFAALGAWCRSLPGQAIVCEGAGAEWLPFRTLVARKGSMRKSIEMIWTNENPA